MVTPAQRADGEPMIGQERRGVVRTWQAFEQDRINAAEHRSGPLQRRMLGAFQIHLHQSDQVRMI